MTFAQARSATEVTILFKRTTFLDIATSSPPDVPEQANGPSSTPYALTSELIKALKHSCARMRSEFCALEIELPGFTVALDDSAEPYILLIVYSPTVSVACLAQTPLLCDSDDVSICRDGGVKDNIRLGVSKFEGPQTDSILPRCMLSVIS
jgi:hypothetical protein